MGQFAPIAKPGAFHLFGSRSDTCNIMFRLPRFCRWCSRKTHQLSACRDLTNYRLKSNRREESYCGKSNTDFARQPGMSGLEMLSCYRRSLYERPLWAESVAPTDARELSAWPTGRWLRSGINFRIAPPLRSSGACILFPKADIHSAPFEYPCRAQSMNSLQMRKGYVKL